MPDLTTASYKIRRSWSDAHLEAVKAALGRRFFAATSFEQDAINGIDLYVPELHISVRIRQLKYQNFRDFTVRTSNAGGHKTEYAKLMTKNCVEYMLYAYALDNKTLAAGYLIDLKQFRLSLIRGEIKPQFRRNKDGSHFVAFSFYEAKRKPRIELAHYVEQIL